MARTPAQIHVSIEGDFDWTDREFWPDGDAPEQPTAAQAAAVMEASGLKGRVLDDWMLTAGLRVTVTVGNETVEVWRRG